MNVTDRQRALYAEFVPPRTDGGKPYTVEDHLHQLRLAERHGLSDEGLASVLGVPATYLRSLRATLKGDPQYALPVTSEGDGRHFTDAPSWFRCQCQAGDDGTAGYELAQHLGARQPPAMDAMEWQCELDHLTDLLMPVAPEHSERARHGEAVPIVYELRDDAACLAWFDQFYPACMALIPAQGRQPFLEGVYRAVEDGGIDLGIWPGAPDEGP
jgi:hypothetical protein